MTSLRIGKHRIVKNIASLRKFTSSKRLGQKKGNFFIGEVEGGLAKDQTFYWIFWHPSLLKPTNIESCICNRNIRVTPGFHQRQQLNHRFQKCQAAPAKC